VIKGTPVISPRKKELAKEAGTGEEQGKGKKRRRRKAGRRK